MTCENNWHVYKCGIVEICRRVIDKIDQSEFEGFEYVNPLLMSLEDCVWQEPQFLVQQHQQEEYQRRQQCYIYELQDKLAMLRFDQFHNISSIGHSQHDNIFNVGRLNSEVNENDNNYNDYRLSPPFPFHYGSGNVDSRSLSITDVTCDTGNNNNSNNNHNNNSTSYNSDDNDYDDVEEETPRKRLLKQMFCLPLN